jgi:hypothetical protein
VVLVVVGELPTITQQIATKIESGRNLFIGYLQCLVAVGVKRL